MHAKITEIRQFIYFAICSLNYVTADAVYKQTRYAYNNRLPNNYVKVQYTSRFSFSTYV